MLPKLHWIRLQNHTSILDQLRLEESLLRVEEESFCVVNFGSPKTIVMGISGQMNALVDIQTAQTKNVPVLRRFSGGGTVIVDANTLFISLIIAKKDLPISPFPEPILQWTAHLYASAWEIDGFCLRENDYCIGDKKCGGNAQYIRKERWLHHTSFLWDFEDANMDLLFLPSKRPAYRKDRSHAVFLDRLKHYGSSPEERIAQCANFLSRYFSLVPSIRSIPCATEHRKATEILLPAQSFSC